MSDHRVEIFRGKYHQPTTEMKMRASFQEHRGRILRDWDIPTGHLLVEASKSLGVLSAVCERKSDDRYQRRSCLRVNGKPDEER